ncbi:MAG: Ig domain protein group 2 domain protein [Gemmatimonadetes bacterium]|nr:Ig domain protein group 2 domain protein [Gemmatimonadota bacterium]
MPIRASHLLLAATLLGGCSFSDNLVRPPAVDFIGVSPAAMVLTIGQSRQMIVVLRDASGNLLTGRTVRWAVEDSTSARISATGQLTAVGQGYITITATSEGKRSSVGATIVPVEASRQ